MGKIFVCNNCNKGFYDNSSLNFHSKSHLDDRPFPCSVCQKQFKTKSKLKRHQLFHSSVRLYSCNKCSAKFHTGCGLRKHVETHALELKFNCEKCGKKFPGKHALQAHNLRSHQQKQADFEHDCLFCARKFKNVHHLLRHIAVHTHEKPYSCGLCDKSFPENYIRFTHMRRFHTRELSYMCTKCPAAFVNCAGLRKHTTTNHTERVRSIKCSRCSQMFFSNIELLLHENRIHQPRSEFKF